MEFDMSRICTKEADEKFFANHKTEVIAACMRIQPNTDGLGKTEKIKVQVLAMNSIAEKHGYGPFANLCDTCRNNFPQCNANTENDIMYGWAKGKDNVCFCKAFESAFVGRK